MKNMLMIEYLTNLLFFVHLKLSGKKIQGSKCVERLAELRCVSIFILFEDCLKNTLKTLTYKTD